MSKPIRLLLFGVLLGFVFLGPVVADEAANTVRMLEPDFWSPPDAIVLSGLQRVSEIPESVAGSMLVESFPYATPIGVEVPAGTQRGSSVWFDSPLIKVNDAEASVRYIGQRGPNNETHMILAGYKYPVPPDHMRTPWLVFTSPATKGKHHRCEFVIASDGKNRDDLSELREVVAIDSKAIYFKAVTPEGTEGLVAAKYRFQSESGRYNAARK